MLIWLKKYLNPHENSCSKVISILTTGNILRSTATQISTILMVYFVLTPRRFAYRYAANTFYQLQRGFGGRRQHARIQLYLVLSLFYSLQRGSNGFIAEKTILILYQGSRGEPLFSGGGGCQTLSRGGGGGAMLISLETHIRTCYFPGGVSGPPIPLWIRTWAMSS